MIAAALAHAADRPVPTLVAAIVCLAIVALAFWSADRRRKAYAAEYARRRERATADKIAASTKSTNEIAHRTIVDPAAWQSGTGAATHSPSLRRKE